MGSMRAFIDQELGNVMANGHLPVRNIIVVGAGIAGLACAMTCARAGAQVDVLEAGAFAARTHAPFDVVPNLLRDLATIGVAHDFAHRGFAYSGFAVVDQNGAPRHEVSTPRLAGDRLPAALGIAYDAALEILATHAVGAGARIRRGVNVTAVDAISGTALIDGGQRMQATLIVLATGARSHLVESTFGLAEQSGTQTWWHALLPRPTGLERATWMAGMPGRRLLLLPISMEQAGLAVLATPPAGAELSASALAEVLGGWGEYSRQLAALLPPDGAASVHVAGGAVLPRAWYSGAVVCAGAAAHAVARPFGQSAAQAVEDAIVLGELVGAGLKRAAVLDGYMARRSERAHRVHELTERAVRWMTRPEAQTDLTALAQEIGDLVSAPA